MSSRPIKLLVVDDNDFIAESLRRSIRNDPSFEWSGYLASAAALPAAAAGSRPDVVLLDVDMPGEDSFEALRGVVRLAPAPSVVMFSGHIRKALIDRAIAEGARGYLSKNDPIPTVIDLVRRVADGEFALSPEAHAEHTRPDPTRACRVTVSPNLIVPPLPAHEPGSAPLGPVSPPPPPPQHPPSLPA